MYHAGAGWFQLFPHAAISYEPALAVSVHLRTRRHNAANVIRTTVRSASTATTAAQGALGPAEGRRPWIGCVASAPSRSRVRSEERHMVTTDPYEDGTQ